MKMLSADELKKLTPEQLVEYITASQTPAFETLILFVDAKILAVTPESESAYETKAALGQSLGFRANAKNNMNLCTLKLGFIADPKDSELWNGIPKNTSLAGIGLGPYSADQFGRLPDKARKELIAKKMFTLTLDYVKAEKFLRACYTGKITATTILPLLMKLHGMSFTLQFGVNHAGDSWKNNKGTFTKDHLQLQDVSCDTYLEIGEDELQEEEVAKRTENSIPAGADAYFSVEEIEEARKATRADYLEFRAKFTAIFGMVASGMSIEDAQIAYAEELADKGKSNSEEEEDNDDKKQVPPQGDKKGKPVK